MPLADISGLSGTSRNRDWHECPSPAPGPSEVIAALRGSVQAIRSELDATEAALADLGAVSQNSESATLLTVAEAAQVLRASRSRIFELLASGELAGVKIGRSRLVPRASIEAYLARLVAR